MANWKSAYREGYKDGYTDGSNGEPRKPREYADVTLHDPRGQRLAGPNRVEVTRKRMGAYSGEAQFGFPEAGTAAFAIVKFGENYSLIQFAVRRDVGRYDTLTLPFTFGWNL